MNPILTKSLYTSVKAYRSLENGLYKFINAPIEVPYWAKPKIVPQNVTNKLFTEQDFIKLRRKCPIYYENIVKFFEKLKEYKDFAILTAMPKAERITKSPLLESLIGNSDDLLNMMNTYM